LERRAESKKKETPTSQLPSPERFTLTPEATRRLYGICQLEGGADPTVIINQLLDHDTELRRKYRLSQSKLNMVSAFLDSAIKSGWTTESILSYTTLLWNLGITNLDEPTLKNLIALAQAVDPRFWGSIKNFVTYATTYYARIATYRKYLAEDISLEQLVRDLKL
jgi:hypothetical protein